MNRPLILALAALAAGSAAVQTAPLHADPPKAKSLDPRERIICRRFIRVGSLVDGYRVCKTRAEWDREHENLQRVNNANSCRDPTGRCERF